ncbi:MAG TPA: hypothetical protein VHX44_13270 [Planctomycetota bacterium]|nr:hypothetical protein [Planctomycetota bacterium]
MIRSAFLAFVLATTLSGVATAAESAIITAEGKPAVHLSLPAG